MLVSKLSIQTALVLVFCLFQPLLATAQKKRPVKKTTRITNLSATQIADRVLPSVVLIITQDENKKPISQGSGFIISQGLVVSNLHVFKRASNAIVKNVKTGETSSVIEVVGMNAKEDICVIRIENTRFPSISLGDSNSVKTGDEIYVVSNPKGLEGSFAKGIISSLRNDVGLLQIDAAISSGSSGGVLLNQKAEAIGIIKSSLVEGQNLNFAIPINKLKILSHKFKDPIQLAGACAYKDRDKEKLKGLVKTVTEKSRYQTIENGKLIETEPLKNRVTTYDLDGNKIEDQFNSVEGKFVAKFVYEFDENRMAKSIRQLSGINNLLADMSKITGREVKDNFINERILNLKDRIEWKLSNRGFSQTQIINDEGDKQIFDSEGNMIVWFIKNTKQTYEYDAQGRVKGKIQWRNGKMEIRTRFRYKDDNLGNWIEKTEYNNYPNTSNLQINPDDWLQGETIYREITYYE